MYVLVRVYAYKQQLNEVRTHAQTLSHTQNKHACLQPLRFPVVHACMLVYRLGHRHASVHLEPLQGLVG